jgi:prepilin-type N-terminal cleavage/methylation domain-containing protein
MQNIYTYRPRKQVVTMKNSRGFTLIEMSIVLVIIGLLVGGILMGRDLLRQAEIQPFMTETDKYSRLALVFKEKYQYLPGDMPDATSLWGIQAGATGNDDICYGSASTTQTTCNGNGDGMITTGHTNTGGHEMGRFWQHLANAGYISGQYTGVRGISPTQIRVGGLSDMKGPIAGSNIGIGWVDGYRIDAGFVANYFRTAPGHWVSVAFDWQSPQTEAGVEARKVFTPLEQLNLDTKFDDGKPGTGKILTSKPTGWQAPNCATTTDELTAQYNTALSTRECFYIYLPGF